MTARPRVRCLLGMLGTDVHSKGIRTLARWLRDEGMEVVYMGEHNTLDTLIRGLQDEDVDVLGLSFSSGGYLVYMERVMAAMREHGLGDIHVMVGGQIHPHDEEKLRQIGVSGIFGPGTTKNDVLDYLDKLPALDRS
jgi:methylmalonyl-CoA mutase, C-terminal domain